MLIQFVYDMVCGLNSFLHLITDWMLDIPILRYLAVALNWVFDGFKAVEHHLLFTDLINLQPNPAEYSVWHYRVNYGLHFFFAFLTVAVVCFLVMRLIADAIWTIQDGVEGKKIRALESELNEKLKAAGSAAVYRCRYEDWKYMISYDESPFAEACKYMRKTIAEIERFIASGGDGGKITDVEDVYRLNDGKRKT